MANQRNSAIDIVNNRESVAVEFPALKFSQFFEPGTSKQSSTMVRFDIFGTYKQTSGWCDSIHFDGPDCCRSLGLPVACRPGFFLFSSSLMPRDKDPGRPPHFQRSGAVGACRAHNPEAVGSKPTFATGWVGLVVVYLTFWLAGLVFAGIIVRHLNMATFHPYASLAQLVVACPS